MEFEHLCLILHVNEERAVVVLIDGHREAGLHLDKLTVDTPEEGADYSVLACRPSHEMVQNVGDDSWVNLALQLFDLQAVVKVG